MIAETKIVAVGGVALGAAVITGDQITQIITAIGVIVFGIMTRMDTKKQDTANKVADAKMDSIHTLVNSAMGSQKKVNAALAQRVADLTQDPADKAIAEEAAKLSIEHEKKQHEIDSKNQAELDAAIDKVKAEFAEKGKL